MLASAPEGRGDGGRGGADLLGISWNEYYMEEALVGPGAAVPRPVHVGAIPRTPAAAPRHQFVRRPIRGNPTAGPRGVPRHGGRRRRRRAGGRRSAPCSPGPATAAGWAGVDGRPRRRPRGPPPQPRLHPPDQPPPRLSPRRHRPPRALQPRAGNPARRSASSTSPPARATSRGRSSGGRSGAGSTSASSALIFTRRRCVRRRRQTRRFAGPALRSPRDALRLPFANGAFDYALCTMFLHHLDDALPRRSCARWPGSPARGSSAPTCCVIAGRTRGSPCSRCGSGTMVKHDAAGERGASVHEA